MFSATDITGVCAMIPTPCKEGAAGWDATDSVDLDAAADMVERLISDGVSSIAACGTTGECAALLWDEKQRFIETIAKVNNHRVPLFAGATSLGTKETVRQTRGLLDVGADGAFVGLPLWQTPTIENSVRFFADLGEAMPNMPIMVYANAMFFKSTFPTVFWEGVAKTAPTVIATKIVYSLDHLLDDIAVAGHQINFMPGQNSIVPAYKLAGTRITACWSTSAIMGPEPIVALMDAIRADDAPRVDAIAEDLGSIPSVMPPGQAEHFAEYNVQAEKTRFNASGYVRCGPIRAPYVDLPQQWAERAEAHGKAWVALRARYAQKVKS